MLNCVTHGTFQFLYVNLRTKTKRQYEYKPPIMNKITDFIKSRSLLSILIIANVGVWVVTKLVGIITSLFSYSGTFSQSSINIILRLSSDLDELSYAPLSLLTYMIVHNSFWSLAFNMVVLYFAGSLACRYIGSKKLGWIYFLSGLTGGLIFLLIYNVFPIGQSQSFSLMGSSTAVLGVLTAIFTYMPRYETTVRFTRIFSIKLQYIYIATVATYLLTVPAYNPGALFALVGAALFGFCYIKVSRRAKQTQGNKAKRKARKRNTYEQHTPLSDEEFNYRKTMEQKRIDDILEKIAKYGYEKLTKEEKDILFNYKA